MTWLCLNEDSTHFFSRHSREEMNREGVWAWVDLHAGTQVRDLILNTNAQRASHPCRSKQPMWDGYDPARGLDQPYFFAMLPECGAIEGDVRVFMKKMVDNMLAFEEQGTDFYSCAIDRAREKGIRPWISMRMNDVHWVDDPGHVCHDRFWRGHPEYRILARRPKDWNAQSLDYGHEAVRAYQLAYVREVVGRYDMDGLELDWMRFGHFFRPGYEEEGRALLTGFTEEARSILDNREKELGHPIALRARVPSRPEYALTVGLDPVAWARAGLINDLVVTPFLFLEPDMPIELWKQILSGTDVTLTAGLMNGVRGYPGGVVMGNTIEMTRGAAISLLDRGADGICLFNYFTNIPVPGHHGPYRRLLSEVGNIQTMTGKSRRHVVTESDFGTYGKPASAVLPCTGEGSFFRVPIGPVPGRGQRARVRVAVERPEDRPPTEQWVVRVNDTVCRFAGEVSAPSGFTLRMHAFDVPEGVLHRGTNVVEFDSAATPMTRLEWVEIAVGNDRGEWSAEEDETFVFA